MFTEFIKATPGWGTSSIDSMINKWVKANKVEIVDIKYESHKEMFQMDNGFYKEDIAYTALIIYKLPELLDLNTNN